MKRGPGQPPKYFGTDCGADLCDKDRQYGSAWCSMHRARLDRTGSLDLAPTSQGMPLRERFAARVAFSPEPEGCWFWLGYHDKNGYGRVGHRGKNLWTHRVAYELWVGPIPEGLHLDHLCRNTRCVNPGHLEPVTHAENLRRGYGVSARNARKTHCAHGHAYDEANTGTTKAGGRYCKACAREKAARYYRRRAAA